MIDPTLPMELDDGTPVVYVKHDHQIVSVRIPGDYRRDGRGIKQKRPWAYHISDGVWSGSDAATCFVLRNSNVAPEEYEGWFV